MSEPIIVPAGLIPRPKKNVFGFAGGGGSSEAAALAGLSVDAALNHWNVAIGVHQANHPECDHFLGDIFDTPCDQVLPGEPIGLAWFSPDCRHFSKAKGGTPVSARVRGLAWVVIQWAKLRRPDVIMMENVEEWLTWSPLRARPDGLMEPDPDRKGETAALWFKRLGQCGYRYEYRVTMAADYGDPTLRKRLLIIAIREDLGRDPVWPAPTHAPRLKAPALHLKPHRAAAEIIDFSRPCPSIFLTRAEARALGVKRPLEEATLRRIARGLFRYTIDNADPFIVPVTQTRWKADTAYSAAEPLRTMTTSKGGEFAVVSPSMIPLTHQGDARTYGPGDPLPTVTGAHRGELAVIAPHLVRTDQSSSAGRAGVRDVQDPAATITGAGGLALVAAIVTGCGGRMGQTEPRDARDPYPTITSKNDSALVAAWMEQANTGMTGHDARSPVSTIVQRGTTQRLITAQLAQMRGSNRGKGDVDDPVGGLTAGGGHQALLEAILQDDVDLARPFGPRGDELRAFLVKYYGSATAEDLAEPLATTTSRARFGLVMVRGVAYRIVDIGMRMLDPETELAAAMGFRRDFKWVGADGRKITKTNITKLVGNAVCREWAAAHIRANCGHLISPTTEQREAA